MDKKIIETKLIKILKKKSIKLNKVNNNTDLYRSEIIDSFDVINIIEDIDNLFKINLDLTEKKTFKFSINYLTKNILKKVKKNESN